jgi:hypothetical protein
MPKVPKIDVPPPPPVATYAADVTKNRPKAKPMQTTFLGNSATPQDAGYGQKQLLGA